MNTTEILAAVSGLVGSSLVAYLAYKRGTKADDAAGENAANAAVYAGYGGLLKTIQDDNTELRRRLIAAEEQIAALREQIATLLEKGQAT